MCGGNHKDCLFPIIDFIKESPGTDSIAPSGRFIVFKTLDMGPVVRMFTKLGVDHSAQFTDYGGLTGSCDMA